MQACRQTVGFSCGSPNGFPYGGVAYGNKFSRVWVKRRYGRTDGWRRTDGRVTTDGWLLVFHNLGKTPMRLLKSFLGHNKHFLDFIRVLPGML